MGELYDAMEIEDDLPDFTLAEVLQMNNLHKEMGEAAISQEFCEELAAKFNCSVHRSAKPPLGWEQVLGWFQDKRKHLSSIAIPSDQKGIVPAKAPIIRDRAKVSTISTTESAAVLPNLMFEARSAKDYAWFDVACFLNYKVLCSGELLVRARFAGFGKDQDEWVSVKRAVRERSIPLEQSECDKVNVGDLVLCYKDTDDHALYCDAHILEIERKPHDSDCCTCIFLVHYDFTQIQEKVPLNKLCYRPIKVESNGSADGKTIMQVEG